MEDNYPPGVERFAPSWAEEDGRIPQEGDDDHNLQNIDEEELEMIQSED